MIHSDQYTLAEYEVVPKFEKCDSKVRKDDSKGDPSHNFSVRIFKMDSVNMEIDFIGCHFSLVNAYRRIVLAEVATMAIEKVYMYNNTSIVQDEVLSHRLGLVPLNVPPHLFNFRKTGSEATESDSFAEDLCIKFRLRVKCRGTKDSKPNTVQTEDDVNTQLVDKIVTSESLLWVPLGDQKSKFLVSPAPLKETINLKPNVKTPSTGLVLAKLNAGQKILLEAVAYKGIGSDHAKFQPGLCWYRMLPEVTLNRRVLNDDARQLQRCFSPGVIELIKNEEGNEEALIMDARYDSCSRNVYNYDNLKDAVTMSRRSDHIIFHIESHSALKSYEILENAVNIMIDKCDSLLELL